MCVSLFFSSRRRHTRWPRDWSSDVCSSDLRGWHLRNRGRIGSPVVCQPSWYDGNHVDIERGGGRTGSSRARCQPRSEERRVGKECGSWKVTVRGGEKNNARKHWKQVTRKRT